MNRHKNSRTLLAKIDILPIAKARGFWDHQDLPARRVLQPLLQELMPQLYDGHYNTKKTPYIPIAEARGFTAQLVNRYFATQQLTFNRHLMAVKHGLKINIKSTPHTPDQD